MSVHKSILALTLVSASVSVIAVGGAVAGAHSGRPTDLSSFRTAIAGAEALLDKGDLTEARTRIESLDAFWERAPAGSTPDAAAHWSIVDRAIDRGLDRALLALRPWSPNAAMGGKALADLLAAVDQVSGKIKRTPMEGAHERHFSNRTAADDLSGRIVTVYECALTNSVSDVEHIESVRHVPMRRARSVGVSRIVSPRRRRCAACPSPQHEVRGAFGLK